MFLIRTRVGPSLIHGVGVFAAEAVEAGQVIWRFDPAFDRLIGDEERDALPAAFRDYLDTYAYRSADVGNKWVLSCDHAKFLNHSEDPNTAERPFESVAARPIALGEEITCDYRLFVVGWEGFG